MKLSQLAWTLSVALTAACNNSNGGGGSGLDAEVSEGTEGDFGDRDGDEAPDSGVEEVDGEVEADDDGGIDPDAGDASSGATSCLGFSTSGAGVVLQTGHAKSITYLAQWPDRLLSATDVDWILWDAEQKRQVRAGQGKVVGHGGEYFLTQHEALFELHSGLDGSTLATVTAEAFYVPAGVARDGSYFFIAGTKSLRAWSPEGELLTEIAKNYNTGGGDRTIDAAPGELRVGNGPNDRTRIEYIQVPGNTSSFGAALDSSFAGWFEDGERALGRLGNNVFVYSSDGVRQKLVATTCPAHERLRGIGNHFWCIQSAVGPLLVYQVDGPSSQPTTIPVVHAQTIFVSQDFLAFAGKGDAAQEDLYTVDLRDPSLPPAKIEYKHVPTAFAAFGSEWVAGSSQGMVSTSRGETPSCGMVLSIAGAPTGDFAFSTASGDVFLGAPGSQLEHAFSTNAPQLELSDDGRLLAMRYGATPTLPNSGTFRIYDLDENALLYESVEDSALRPMGMALSGNGERLVQIVQRWTGGGPGPLVSEVVDAMGVLQYALEPFSWAFVSPDGTHLVLQDAESAKPSAYWPYIYPVGEYNSVLSFFEAGQLVDVVAGSGVGFVAADQLLVKFCTKVSAMLGACQRWEMRLYDRSGQHLRTTTLSPSIASVDLVQGGRFYAPDTNQIYDVATDTVVDWPARIETTERVSAVAGGQVIQVREGTVVTTPLP